MNPGSYIKRILIEKEAEGLGFASRVLDRLKDVPRLDSSPGKGASAAKTDLQKETLRLVCHKGEFLKPCPGTKEYICCGYRILNVATNCPLDCSYCILQTYFNQPGLRVFANLEQRIGEVLGRIDAEPEKIFRVGTGEFTDSLALDPVAGWSDLLIPLFSRRKNAILELKTKTDRIDAVLSSKHRDRIVLSWSLNSPYIVSREEHRAPSLAKRLEAARRCQREGYVLGFHFDPLVAHPGWKEGYARTLDLLDRYVDPKRVIWVSMGSFRFMPGLKPIIRRRHPETCILNGEFVVGLDGKMRYFKPVRTEMYAHMKEGLQAWRDDLGVYLCMESDDVWEKSMGWSPGDSAGLRRYLDNRVLRLF